MLRKRRKDRLGVTEGDEGGANAMRMTMGPTTGGAFSTTLCTEVSIRAREGQRTSAVKGRLRLLGSCMSRGPSVRVCSICDSSSVDNASFLHPRFSQVVGSVHSNGMGYIVMGSFSHLKHGFLRSNRCVRVMFPFFNIHFVTVASQFSALGRRTSVSMRLGGLTGRVCTGSVSEGVYSAVHSVRRRKGFTKDGTPCKCQLTPRSGRYLVISRRATPIMGRVFRLLTSKGAIRCVTAAFGTEKVPSPKQLVCSQKVAGASGFGGSG